MPNNIITLTSNPNNLVTGNVGDIFYRSGNNIFQKINGVTRQDVALNETAATFVRKIYNVDFYKHSRFDFATQYETWIKVSGTGSTGWQYVGPMLPVFPGASGENGGGPPDILDQPLDQQINTGQTAPFSITAEE